MNKKVEPGDGSTSPEKQQSGVAFGRRGYIAAAVGCVLGGFLGSRLALFLGHRIWPAAGGGSANRALTDLWYFAILLGAVYGIFAGIMIGSRRHKE